MGISAGMGSECLRGTGYMNLMHRHDRTIHTPSHGEALISP